MLVNKKKWTVAGQVLASRGERQNDVMDIFQVPRVTNVDIYKLIRIWSELCYGHFPDWFLEYYQIILWSLSFKPFDVMDIFQVGFYNLIRSYDDVLGWFLEYDDPGCFLEYDDDKDQIFKLETYFAGRLVGPRSDEGCRLMHTQPIGLFYLIIEKSDNLWQWYPGWFHWLIDGQLWNYKRLHGCHTILIHFR